MLIIKDLTISLKEGKFRKHLVENSSFSLKQGESLGIVGESGSGKTITALSILKLLPPGVQITSGSIIYDSEPDKINKNRSGAFSKSHKEAKEIPGGRNLVLLDEKQMQTFRGRVVSMIFQEPMTSLNPSMRCGDQVAEAVRHNPRLAHAGVKEKMVSLLGEVHLPSDPSFYRKYPHELSGGQRQRIMIAMALAGDPEILIADEPTTALDVTVQKKILDLLKEIRQNRNMSMLFISHDLGVVRIVCDRALVMYRGKIVESGTIEELFSNAQNPYTRGLIACRPVPGSNPDRLPTLADYSFDIPEAGAQDPEIPSPKKIKDTTQRSAEMKPSAGKVTSRDKTPLFEVRHLHARYTLKKNLMGRAVKNFHAVNDASFIINEGETLGLIGESGCGKSTLGRSIIRLIQFMEGDILYRGKNILSFRGKELKAFRQKVQFIFQDPYSSLNPKIAAGPAIMEVMKVHGLESNRKARQKAVQELLASVGLEKEHFNRFPHEFSGGQRQRIGLARALATNPELIICDESVSSLDVSVQASILNLLNDLKDSFNLTYLFISHDLSVVRYMAERIMVMKNGKLIETGTGLQVFSNPGSDYTKELIGSILR